MASPALTGTAHSRLLCATEALIYAHGIAATGMDLIVKTSGVARKTIYSHYGSKDELVAAALRQRDERWMQWFIEATSRAASARGRYASIFPALRSWFESDGFRGCAFINAAAETSDPDSPIRAVCRLHKQHLLDYLGRMVRACGMRNAQETARQLLLLIDGAIAMAQVSGNPASADTASLMARRLVTHRAAAAGRAASP